MTNDDYTKYQISKHIYATTKYDYIRQGIRRWQNCGFLFHKNGRYIHYYCNKIFCIECERRKLWHYEKRYAKILETHKYTQNFYFFTIAPKRVDGNQLYTAINEIQKLYRSIRYEIKKRFSGGIARLELTYEPHEKTYKPHYHIILSANHLLEEKDIKTFMFSVCDKIKAGQGAGKVDGLTAKPNGYGNDTYTTTAGGTNLNIVRIQPGTETETLSYILKPSELFYTSENVLDLIKGIKSHIRYVTSFGTLKKTAPNK